MTSHLPYPPPGYPAPVTAPVPRPAPKAKRRWWLWLLLPTVTFVLMSCMALGLGIGVLYAQGILPGVSSGGVNLGGLSYIEAVNGLRAEWQTVTLRDGERRWEWNAAELGINLDAESTARAAYDVGRVQLGNTLRAMLGRIEVAPQVTVDAAALEAALSANAAQFDQNPVNAGVAFIDGQVQPTPPQNGRLLDVNATVDTFRRSPTGTLDLVMQSLAPTVTDSTPMLEQARALLSNPLDIRLYDPVTGDSVYWSLPPSEWATWLSATPDAQSPTGLALTAADAPVRTYLTTQAAAVLDASRYLNMDEAVQNVQQSITAGHARPWARVYHQDRQYVVQPGETITSIAWDVGVPYLYIVQANGGLQGVSPGQSITIPSPDVFLPYAPDPDKRIVVSISQQRVWVYEQGALKWEWLASTGIADSPTWPGIYQVISHVPSAYAGNWDLLMPSFMGVYQPIPGADFTNGFHGFPTRGGWQLLWTNSLGTRVTYGCILLSNENAEALYNWAQTGVVVEIQA
jgi:lipoprotein-anchoring transpeptidase ErfK/SrfK